MLTKQQIVSAENGLTKFLMNYYGATIEKATDKQLYFALAKISNAILYDRREKVLNEKNISKKTVHYMSIELKGGRNISLRP